MKRPLIGIPRALLSCSYLESWKQFFDEIGCEVAVSPETTADILREGLRHTIGDLCLPVKTFLGHVAVLKDTVDMLFIPRYISAELESYMCPKMIGLPDVVRACFTNLPPLLDPMMHVKQFGEKAFFEFTRPLAKALRARHHEVLEAFRKCSANRTEMPDVRHMQSVLLLSDQTGLFLSRKRMNIGIIGRPYLLFDRHLSKNIFAYISGLGAHPLYIRHGTAEIREAMTIIPKWVYWDMGKEVVTAAHHFFRDDRIDGVINICSATCGPDSFTGDLIRKRLNPKNKPYMSLSIDEHTSDVGIETRIEAFMDMIARVTA